MNAACAPGACHNDIGANSCTCSSGYESVEEDGKLICAVWRRSDIPVRNSTGKIQFGHTVHYSCDVGHPTEKGVLDAFTQWTVSCDTGGVLVLSIEIHGAVCRFILTHSVVLPNYQEDETMLRETLENRGRSLSTEKHKRIVLAMEAPRVRTCNFLEDAHFNCAWMAPGGSH